jgi:GTP-binding protein EngB required for normal cell division
MKWNIFEVFMILLTSINSKKQEESKPTKSINLLILGESGSGKTSLIKLFQDTKDETLPSADPNTKYASAYSISIISDNYILNINIVDTIGYGSTDTDQEVLKQLSDAFDRVQYIDFVIILFKGERWNPSTFVGFQKTFNFLKNTGFRDENILPYITKMSYYNEIAKKSYKDTFMKYFRDFSFMSKTQFGNFMDCSVFDSIYVSDCEEKVSNDYHSIKSTIMKTPHSRVYPGAYIKCNTWSNLVNKVISSDLSGKTSNNCVNKIVEINEKYFVVDKIDNQDFHY